MKFSSLGTALTLSSCLVASAAFANPNGISGYSGKGAATCTNCHSVAAASPTVAITGPTTLAAGTSGDYTFTITGGPAVTSGTDIALSNSSATLAPATGSGLKLLGGELVHSAPKSFSGGSVSYGFKVTAPASAGTLVIYAAGNSANGNGSNTGDGIATTKLDISVTGSSGGGTDGGTDSGTDAGTGSTPGTDMSDDSKGGCSSTGSSPVVFLALAGAGVALLRRRHA